MKCYSLSHLANATLLQALAALVTQDRATTAALLAHLAEVDERKLYVPASYPSMYLYCVHELHMSEDTAFRRIGVARTARRFPVIFAALADGRLNLTAVLLLTPYLTPETADELLAAAAHKTKPEVGLLLAERFPQPDVPTLVGTIAAPVVSGRLAARPVTAMDGSPDLRLAPERVGAVIGSPDLRLAPERVGTPVDFNAPVRMGTLASRTKIAPLSPGGFALQVTVDQETHDLLRYAQALLGHALPSGDVATVLNRALISLVRELEQQKFAKSARSRPRRSAAHGRYIPADVRRAVWQRDGGQCTFVSEHGKRCASTTRLEFDHLDAVARGGETSVARMRLRCRAHNQYAAECAFGAGFMRDKRDEARCRAAQAHERGQVRAQADGQARARAAASSPS